MKQYTPIINLSLIAIDDNKEVQSASVVTQNDIGEFSLESNLFLGTHVLKAKFIDTDLFFSRTTIADNTLYIRAESLGDEVATIQTQYYKIISWDTYSNNMVEINLALPSLYTKLASDNTLKIYSKEIGVDKVFKKIAKRNDAESMVSTQYPLKALAYDLVQYDNSLNFLRTRVLPNCSSMRTNNNDFHMMIGSNKMMLVPALYSAKPYYRIKIGEKIKAYQQIKEDNIVSTEWTKNFMASFADNVHFPVYYSFHSKDQSHEEIEFDTAQLSIVDAKTFNYMEPNSPIRRLIDYPGNVLSHGIINNFNKNFGFKIFIPVNTYFVPNIVVDIDTTLDATSEYNSWFSGKALVYSVEHFYKRSGDDQQMISILKCIKNGHNFNNTMFDNAQTNSSKYKV